MLLWMIWKNQWKKLSDNINVITSTVIKNTDEYIKPLCSGNLAGLSSNSVKEIEENDR